MTIRQQKELVALRAAARKRRRQNFGAVCQFVDSNFKNKVIGHLQKANVPASELQAAYHDVLDRVADRLHQLRRVRRFAGWRNRIAREMAKRYRPPYVEPPKRKGTKPEVTAPPKQIGTKWIALDGEEHKVTVFEPASRPEELPQRQRRLEALSDSNLFRKSSLNRPDYADGIDVRRALAKLPKPWAIAFLLVKYVGLSAEETGQRVGLSQGQVYKILAKTKKRLRGSLAVYAQKSQPNSETCRNARSVRTKEVQIAGWKKPCHVVPKLTEDFPGEHRYVLNCSVCQRDVSDEWTERKWGDSEPQASLKPHSCPLDRREAVKKFFTIGYGGTEPEVLVEVLKQHGIEAVVDVRLWPHRSNMGSYVLANSPEKGIQRLLAKEGILYHSFIELGNPFFQFHDWQDRYRQLLSPSGKLLTERLLTIPERCCLLCAEKQPAACHRSIIAEFLIQRGHEVEHLVAQ